MLLATIAKLIYQYLISFKKRKIPVETKYKVGTKNKAEDEDVI